MHLSIYTLLAFIVLKTHGNQIALPADTLSDCTVKIRWSPRRSEICISGGSICRGLPTSSVQ